MKLPNFKSVTLPVAEIIGGSQKIHAFPGYVKKGEADHARMDVGGVLISLTLAVSP